MSQIVGVRFKLHGSVHYFDPFDISLTVGDNVTVETDCGSRDGRVVIAPGQVAHSDLRGPIGRVIGIVEPGRA